MTIEMIGAQLYDPRSKDAAKEKNMAGNAIFPTTILNAAVSAGIQSNLRDRIPIETTMMVRPNTDSSEVNDSSCDMIPQTTCITTYRKVSLILDFSNTGKFEVSQKLEILSTYLLDSQRFNETFNKNQIQKLMHSALLAKNKQDNLFRIIEYTF